MKKYKIKKQEPDYVMDALVSHISKFEAEEKESFHPAFKTNDFCLYNADYLPVLSRFLDNYIARINLYSYNLQNNKNLNVS